MIRDFFAAWIFMTRIPSPYTPPWDADTFKRSTASFPLVGLGLGLILAGIFDLALHFWSGGVAAVLLMICAVLFTGALHEDGLADCADGFWGGYTIEKRLAILKDSSLGVYGVVAIGLSLLLKWNLWSQISQSQIYWSCALVYGLSRWTSPILMYLLPYASDPSKAKSDSYTRGVSLREVFGSSFWALFLLVGASYGLGWIVWFLIPLLMLYVGLCWILFNRKIGGYTGDTLGAAIAVGEIVILLYLVGLACV